MAKHRFFVNTTIAACGEDGSARVVCVGLTSEYGPEYYAQFPADPSLAGLCGAADGAQLTHPDCAGRPCGAEDCRWRSEEEARGEALAFMAGAIPDRFKRFRHPPRVELWGLAGGAGEPLLWSRLFGLMLSAEVQLPRAVYDLGQHLETLPTATRWSWKRQFGGAAEGHATARGANALEDARRARGLWAQLKGAQQGAFVKGQAKKRRMRARAVKDLKRELKAAGVELPEEMLAAPPQQKKKRVRQGAAAAEATPTAAPQPPRGAVAAWVEPSPVSAPQRRRPQVRQALRRLLRAAVALWWWSLWRLGQLIERSADDLEQGLEELRRLEALPLADMLEAAEELLSSFERLKAKYRSRSRKLVWEETAGDDLRCYWCDRGISQNAEGVAAATVDHLEPIRNAGDEADLERLCRRENLVPACRGCNTRRDGCRGAEPPHVATLSHCFWCGGPKEVGAVRCGTCLGPKTEGGVAYLESERFGQISPAEPMSKRERSVIRAKCRDLGLGPEGVRVHARACFEEELDAELLTKREARTFIAYLERLEREGVAAAA